MVHTGVNGSISSPETLPLGTLAEKNGKMWEFLFGNVMFLREKKLWFILHFRTLETFIVGGVSHVKNSKKWKWDSGRPPPLFFSKFPHFPVFLLLFFGNVPNIVIVVAP